MNKIWERVYADYLAGNRLDEYRRLIEASLDLGFHHCTIADLNAAIAKSSFTADDNVFVHRHDIVTDTTGARGFFEIEKGLGVRSTFYFRLSTLDILLMREIHAYGSEVGYHYEELATRAKRRGIDTGASALADLASIRADFERNFRALQDALGFKIRSVASHGDFINRRLSVQNTPILQDADLRKRLGLECESYDPALMAFFNAYLADDLPMRPYKRGSPFEAIQSKRHVCLLTHPRHWRTNPLDNTRYNLWRIKEEIEWQIKSLWCRRNLSGAR